MAQAAESPDGSADDEVARRTDGPLGGSADVTFVPVAARAPSVSTCGPFVSLGDGSDRSIGILTTPYALAQSGWFGLLLLAVTSLLYLLTARLLRACMDHAPATDPHTSTTASQTVTTPPDTSTTALHTSTITTYPDIGAAAFGRTGRMLTSLVLYGELFAVSVELLILEGDSLAFLFPSFAPHGVPLGSSLRLSANQVFLIIVALIVLSAVWLLGRLKSPLSPPLAKPGVSDHRCAHRAPHGVITEDVSAGVCVRVGGLLAALVTVVFLIIAALIVLPTVWLRKMSLLAYVSVGGLLAALVTVVGVAWVAAVGTDDAGSAAASASAATSAAAAAQGGAALLRVQGIPVAMGIFGFCFSGHAVFPTIYRSMDKPQHFNRVLLICFTVCTCIYGGIAILSISISLLLPTACHLSIKWRQLSRASVACHVAILLGGTAAAVTGTIYAVRGIAGGGGGSH
ncbi:unnamed protein product [Closterium sp. Naga37s-1]|nr:unnamed protein product [Closterium sp. Naga37s-1]